MKRTLFVLIFGLLPFLLPSTAIGQGLWNPVGYAIVNNTPGEWDVQHYTTIQSAVDSGASHIRVMAGDYAEWVNIPHALTLECDANTTLLNDGSGVSIAINAPDVTIKGCEIVGEFDGTAAALGDSAHGTGVLIQGVDAHIDGLKTVNLAGFSIFSSNIDADRATIENFDFRNVATNRDAHKCASTAIQFLAGSEGHAIRNGKVSGYSQAIGLWYGASNSVVSGNRLLNNYGWIGSSCDDSRSAIEDYGLNEGNVNNRYVGNYIDGSNSNGFELADVLDDITVSGNTTRNTYGGAFGVAGSGANRGRNIRISDNTFYGTLGNNTNWVSGSVDISGNLFIGYTQNNLGTLFIPADGLGGVKITNNTFDGNGRILHAQRGGVEFTGNTVFGGTYSDHLYLDSGVDSFLIADNQMRGHVARAINAPNGATGVVVRDNTIDGEVMAGEGAWITGNTVHGGAGVGIVIQHRAVVMGNYATSDILPYFLLNPTYALVERNYGVLTNGGAVTVPNNTNCLPSSTCVSNWTSGQVPPP